MAGFTSSKIIEVDGLKVDLRHPFLAAFWAWVFPGAGHFYQRRYGKAACFSLCIMTLLLMGLFLGGSRVVHVPKLPEGRGRAVTLRTRIVTQFPFVLHAPLGLPVMPAVVQYIYLKDRPGAKPLLGGFMAPPASEDDVNKWHRQYASGYDVGWVYTVTAGLLNLLVIFDAFAGPMPVPVDPKKVKKEGANSGSPESGTEAK